MNFLTKRKKVLIAAMATYALCFGAGVAISAPVEANADTIASTFDIQDGASVRIGSEGMRFTSYISVSEMDALIADNGADNVKVVTMITPTRYLETAGVTDFNKDCGVQMSAIEFSSQYKNDDGESSLTSTKANWSGEGAVGSTDGKWTLADDGEYYIYNAVLESVQDYNISRTFSARSYLQVGEETPQYTVYDENNIRDLWTVADNAAGDYAEGTDARTYLDKVSSTFTVTVDSDWHEQDATLNVKYGASVAWQTAFEDVEYQAYFKGYTNADGSAYTEAPVKSNLSLKADFYELGYELNSAEDGYIVTGAGDLLDCERNAEKKVVIPETYKGVAVTEIAAQAFKDNAVIESLYLPNGLTVGEFAFQSCTALKMVETAVGDEERQEGVKAILLGGHAFFKCTALETVKWFSTYAGILQSNDPNNFMNCTSLKNLVVGTRFIVNKQNFIANVEGYTSKLDLYIDASVSPHTSSYLNITNKSDLLNNQFTNNVYVKGYANKADATWDYDENGVPQITEGVKHAYTLKAGDWKSDLAISDCVYENGVCTVCGERKLTDGSLNYSYEEGAGYTVTGLADNTLTEMNIPDTFNGESVVAIADNAFKKNTKLTKVVMGNNITTIGDYAFLECSNLTSVTFSEKLEVLGHQAFQKCTSLTYVKLPSTIKELKGNVFYGCSALEVISMITDHTVTLNPSVTVGGKTFAANNNFSFCTSLKALIVGAKFATSSQQFALNDTQTQGLMHIYSTAKAADGASNAIYCSSGYNNLAFSGKVFFLGEEDGSWSYAADGITPVADDENVYWKNVSAQYTLINDNATA